MTSTPGPCCSPAASGSTWPPSAPPRRRGGTGPSAPSTTPGFRLGVLEGDFHWHKHDDTDEFFLVLEGELLIDFEERDSVLLQPHQGFTVPKGVVHRTRAPTRTAILMVEAAGVAPTGD